MANLAKISSVSVEIRTANFATLHEMKIRLADMVILMGPNNSGKSTAAVILYAACRAMPWRRGPAPGRAYFPLSINAHGGTAIGFDQRYLGKVSRELLKAIRNTRNSEDLKVSFPAGVRQLMKKPAVQLLEVYVRKLADELERCFGEDLKNLARSPSADGRTRVDVSHGDDWTVSFSFVRGRRPTFESSMTEISDDSWEDFLQRTFSSEQFWRLIQDIRSAAIDIDNIDEGDDETLSPRDMAYYLLESLFRRFSEYMFRHFPRNAHYLPASRSGALQSHRALAAAVVRQSSYVGIQDVAIPKLPGVVADFISQLLELQPAAKGRYGSIAEVLQRDVLHGAIELQPRTSMSPEIIFASNGASHGLHRTSSMVSELAAIVLFLRHVVRLGDLLIIEEPESHLHPASQVVFAQTLARLVNANVRVAITTHSDYFINQLSNLIIQHSIEGLGDSLSIKPQAVAAYLFSPTERSGTDVRELPVSDTEGISDEEFSTVAEWLYNQNALLTQESRASNA